MKAEERKNSILDLSTKFFSEQGYYETHIEEIIKEARIGKGTFYRYFKNKDDLFISLLLRFLNAWEKAVFVDPKEFQENNIREQFLSIIKRSFVFFKEHEDLCNIYLRVGPGLSRNFEPYMHQFENQMIDYIAQYLTEGIKLGYVNKDLNLELASNMIAGSFLRVDYYYFVLRKSKEVDINNLADEFFSIIMNGILITE